MTIIICCARVQRQIFCSLAKPTMTGQSVSVYDNQIYYGWIIIKSFCNITTANRRERQRVRETVFASPKKMSDSMRFCSMDMNRFGDCVCVDKKINI